MLLPSSACLAMALLSAPPRSATTLLRAHRLPTVLMSAEREPSDDWRPDEDWALMDAVPAFTAGKGTQVHSQTRISHHVVSGSFHVPTPEKSCNGV